MKRTISEALLGVGGMVLAVSLLIYCSNASMKRNKRLTELEQAFTTMVEVQGRVDSLQDARAAFRTVEVDQAIRNIDAWAYDHIAPVDLLQNQLSATALKVNHIERMVEAEIKRIAADTNLYLIEK